MKNPYVPELAVIEETRVEAPGVKTFKLKLRHGGMFTFTPGQFIELSVFGYGEAPFSVSSSPLQRDFFEVTVRKTGMLTSALFELERGNTVGVRGPFGNGWPIEKMKKYNILMIGGGIGIAPLKPVIEYVVANRKDYEEVILLYGAKTPKDIVFKKELEMWREKIDVHLTVDIGDNSWKGRTGVVTVLFDEIKVNPKETYSIQCGPPIMMYFVTKKLLELGFPEDRILLSLERLMKCGMGFCGHCMISGKFVCKDGPVFSYNQIKDFLESAI